MSFKIGNRRTVKALGCLLGLCLFAAAAFGSSTTAMALTKVKAGHLVALDMAPLFVGKESGCFEKAGLDVETIFFANPGDNNAALAGGSIDFSTNPFTLPFFAANSGVPIRVISGAGGWGIIDFWESRADFDAFSARIAEGIAAAGIEMEGPPDIKEFPVHEMIPA